MEEKKEKLSYEQLESYTAQLTERAKAVFMENRKLKEMLYEQSLKEVEIALKCLDHADMFSEEFINDVVERIEIVMSPKQKEEPKTEEDTKKEETGEEE